MADGLQRAAGEQQVPRFARNDKGPLLGGGRNDKGLLLGGGRNDKGLLLGGGMMRGELAAKTVDQYLAGLPEPARSTLKRVRAVIRSVVPKETTEVISYGIPMFKYNGMLVGYAAFKNHCSLFPTGSGVLDRFEKDLADYRTSKGTIQFPPDTGFPDALLKKIVKARVKENKEWD